MDELAMVASLEASGKYRVVEQFTGALAVELVPRPRGATGFGLALDTETTGLARETDKIIELGLVLFEYDREDGSLIRVVERYNGLEDPGFPIPPESTKVNHITDEMVAGLCIDSDKVAQLCDQAEFIVAHNAGFDRFFCEKRFPFMATKPWACSFTQVDWATEGISSGKLEFIAYRLGFFFEGHRAELDCLAMLEALSRPLPASGVPAFRLLLPKIHSEQIRVWALNSPFSSKELLSRRGYRWGASAPFSASEKAWFIELNREQYRAEIDWLQATIYNGRPFMVVADRVTPIDRFSDRRSESKMCHCGLRQA